MSINNANLPKFKYGTASKIAGTQISNGSFLVDSENSRIYVDINNTRHFLGDIVHVANQDSLPVVPAGKIYMDDSTGNIFYYVNDAWKQLNGSGTVAWSDITNKPESFTPSTHTHTTSQITDFDTAIAELSDIEWADIQNKPSSFTPSAHTHTSANITDLETTVSTLTNGKMNTPSGGTTGQILTKTENGYAWADAPTPTTHEYLFTVSGAGEENANGDYWDNGEGAYINENGYILIYDTGYMCWAINYNNQGAFEDRYLGPADETSPIGTYTGNGGTSPYPTVSAYTGGSIVLDDVPTENSNNGVKSGGVYTALQSKANSTHSHTISEVTGLESTLNGKLTTPSGGTSGQVLTKTADGYGWADASGGDLSGVVLKGTTAAMAAATVGQTLVFVETTTASYTQGHIYKCTGTQAGGYTITDTYLGTLGGTYTPTGNTAQGVPTYYCAENQKYLWLAYYMDAYYCWAISSSQPIAEMAGTPDVMYLGFDVYLDVSDSTQGPNANGTWCDGNTGTSITDGNPDAVVAATPTAGGPVFTDITPAGSSITFDDVPTQNSNNAVKSGGVYSALQDKLDKPATDGTNGQVLTTDGEGHFSWTTPSAGASGNFVTVVDTESALNALKVQANVGKVYVFTGENTATYAKGHHYLCTSVSNVTITMHDEYWEMYNNEQFTPSEYTSNGAPIYATEGIDPYCLVLVKDAADDYYWVLMVGSPETHVDTVCQTTIDAAGYTAYLPTTLATANSHITGNTTDWYDGIGGYEIATFWTSGTSGSPIINLVDITPTGSSDTEVDITTGLLFKAMLSSNTTTAETGQTLTLNNAVFAAKDGTVALTCSKSSATNIQFADTGLPMNNSPRSVSYWAWYTNTSDEQCVVSWGTDNSYQHSSFGATNGHYMTRANAMDVTSANTSITIPTNQWVHVVHTYDGTTAKIYANGTEVASGSWDPSTYSNSNAYLGSDGGSRRMEGWLSDVRIYNRALTTAEIQAIHDDHITLAGLDQRVTTVENFISNIGVSAIRVVDELPANPDTNTLYLIRES